MPPEDSDSVWFSRKMGCNSTTSVKAVAIYMTTSLIGCLGTQPWSVTWNNEIPPWDMLHMHFSNQYQGCHNPVTGKNPGFPLQKPPWRYFINSSWTPKSYCHGQDIANPGFGDGAEFMVSVERPPILGILGRRPQWCLVVRSRSFAHWSWRIVSNWDTNFLIKLISSMVQYSSHISV